MGRRRKKVADIAPDDWASAIEDISTRLLGRSPLAKLVSKLAGNIAYTQTGGKPKRIESNRTRLPKQPKDKVLRLGNGVEYIPPPRSKT